jgi:predicted enzyme related to lactoylglutathione lyase
MVRRCWKNNDREAAFEAAFLFAPDLSGSSVRLLPMKIPVNYVEFTSADVAASRAFFEKAFGWSFTDYGPQYQAFEAGLDGGFAAASDSGDAVAGLGQLPPLVILYAENLDAAEAAMLAAGGEIIVPQFDFPGGRRFHFREPGGNVLAVWSRPQDEGTET